MLKATETTAGFFHLRIDSKLSNRWGTAHGGLLFLMDIDGGVQFKCFYWSTVTIWVAVLIHAGLAFLGMAEERLAAFQTVTFLMYALSLLSVPLFCRAMEALAAAANSAELERDWKMLTRLSALYYILPFIAFLAASIVQASGTEVQLYYGVKDSNLIPAAVVKYGVRVLFFLPPVFLVLRVRKSREVMLRVAP
jgi:hypothetical protein